MCIYLISIIYLFYEVTINLMTINIIIKMLNNIQAFINAIDYHINLLRIKIKKNLIK